MGNTERVVTREVKAVTRKEVVLKAIEGRITWIQAATILGISDRQMRRLKTRYEEHGFGGLRDHRSQRTKWSRHRSQDCTRQSCH